MASEPKPCEDRIYDFYKIPDQSTAELWVEGDDAEFSAGAVVETGSGGTTVPNAKVYRSEGGNQAARARLKKPEITILTLFVNFRKKASVTLNFQIVTPPGSSTSHHSSTPIRCTLGGKKNQEVRRIFYCKTIQS